MLQDLAEILSMLFQQWIGTRLHCVGCIEVSVDECFGREVVHGGRHSLEVGFVDMLSDPDPHVYICVRRSWRGFFFFRVVSDR